MHWKRTGVVHKAWTTQNIIDEFCYVFEQKIRHKGTKKLRYTYRECKEMDWICNE